MKELLDECGLTSDDPSVVCTEEMAALCEQDQELFRSIKQLFEKKAVHGIDRIAVTQGPGLSPALWVGINAARLFSLLWNIPVIPTNHMEGHIVAALLDESSRLVTPPYPLLALLVSGGHTQFVLADTPGAYDIIGTTVDDAAGEAFDKAARLLGLPYPGGPEISRLADEARHRNLSSSVSLPRPMLTDETYNVSFAGLKTAVRRAVESTSFNDEEKMAFAREFEDAVTETLVTKLQRALEAHHPKSIVLGGGVAANRHLRETINHRVQNYPAISFFYPTTAQATDNAVMIALAAYHNQTICENLADLAAEPNRSLSVSCTTSH